MPQIELDRANISLVEDRGTFRGLNLNARILFNQTADQVYVGNHYILNAALDYMTLQGYGPFSKIEPFLIGLTPFKNLVLVKRTPSLTEDKTVVDVALNYEHVLDGHNQTVFDTTDSMKGASVLFYRTIFGKGKTSIVDKTTNFFRKDGDVLSARIQILTSHTYPENETGIAATPYQPDLPRTVFQGGDINIPFPQGNYGFSGIAKVYEPYSIYDIAYSVVATINALPFLGRPAGTWICSEMQWEMHEYGVGPGVGTTVLPRLYKVSFEFQYNVDGWNPTVVFLDQRTGRPPANVQEAIIHDSNGVLNQALNAELLIRQPAGIWQVPALKPLNYSDFFCAFFERA